MAFTLDQDNFQFFLPDAGGDGNPTKLGAENANLTRTPGSAYIFGIRIMLQETGGTSDSVAADYTLYAQKNGTGGYYEIPVPQDGAPATTDGLVIQRWSNAYDYTPRGTQSDWGISGGSGTWLQGFTDDDGNPPDRTVTANNYMEVAYILCLEEWAVSNGDYFDLRVYRNDVALNGTYNQTPRVTVSKTDRTSTHPYVTGYSESHVTGSQSVSAVVPNETEEGDLLIFTICVDDGATNNYSVTNSNTTEIASDSTGDIATSVRWKWAAASQGNETFTLSPSGTNEAIEVICVAIKNANATTPINANAKTVSSSDADPWPVASASATSTNNLIVNCHNTDNNRSRTHPGPAGGSSNAYSLARWDQSGGSGGCSAGIGWRYQDATGSTTSGGTQEWIENGTVTEAYHNYTLVIAPAASTDVTETATSGSLSFTTYAGATVIGVAAQGTQDTLAFTGQAGEWKSDLVVAGTAGSLTFTGQAGQVSIGVEETATAGSLAITENAGVTSVGIVLEATADSLAFTGQQPDATVTQVTTITASSAGVVGSGTSTGTWAQTRAGNDGADIRYTYNVDSGDVYSLTVDPTTHGTSWAVETIALRFGTSSLEGKEVTGVKLRLRETGGDSIEGNSTHHAYQADFGAAIDKTDFLTGTALGSATSLGSRSSWTANGYTVWTLNASAPDAVNVKGNTDIFIVPDEHVTNSTPAQWNYIAFKNVDVSGQEPEIEITTDSTITNVIPDATAGSLTFTGQIGTVDVGADVTEEATAGSLAITEYAGELSISLDEAATAGSLTFTGYAGTASYGSNLVATADTLAFTGRVGVPVADQVYTFYGTEDGSITSKDTVAANARAGTGSTFNVYGQGTSETAYFGYGYNSGDSNYGVDQWFIQFDTSSLSNSATIKEVALRTYGTDQASGDEAARCYQYDWGATLTTSDFRTPTQLQALTDVATLADGQNSSSGADWVSNGNFVNQISRTGSTRLVITMQTNEAGLDPSPLQRNYSGNKGHNHTAGTATDPRLTVTVDGTITSGDSDQVATAGSVAITEYAGTEVLGINVEATAPVSNTLNRVEASGAVSGNFDESTGGAFGQILESIVWSGEAGSTTSIVSNLSGLQVGDLMVVCVHSDGDETFSASDWTGWTIHDYQHAATGRGSHNIASKTATSGDVAKSTWDFGTGTSEHSSGVLFRLPSGWSVSGTDTQGIISPNSYAEDGDLPTSVSVTHNNGFMVSFLLSQGGDRYDTNMILRANTAAGWEHFGMAERGDTTSSINSVIGAFYKDVPTGGSQTIGQPWTYISTFLRTSATIGLTNPSATAPVSGVSLAFSGQDGEYAQGSAQVATAGSLAVTGNAGTEVLGANLEATAGSMAFTGYAGTFFAGTPVQEEATAGSLAITEQIGQLSIGIELEATAGSLAITEYAGEYAQGSGQEATAGSLAFTGYAGASVYGSNFEATQGSLAFTGNQGTTHEDGVVELEATAGTLALTPEKGRKVASTVVEFQATTSGQTGVVGYSSSGTWESHRNAVNTADRYEYNTGGGTLYPGVYGYDGTSFAIEQAVIGWDTSSLPDALKVINTTLRLRENDGDATPTVTIEFYGYDFGATIEAADYYLGSTFDANPLPLIASGSITLAATYNTIPTTDAFNDIINPTGTTRIIGAPSAFWQDVEPGNSTTQYANFRGSAGGVSTGPELTIEYETLYDEDVVAQEGALTFTGHPGQFTLTTDSVQEATAGSLTLSGQAGQTSVGYFFQNPFAVQVVNITGEIGQTGISLDEEGLSGSLSLSGQVGQFGTSTEVAGSADSITFTTYIGDPVIGIEPEALSSSVAFTGYVGLAVAQQPNIVDIEAINGLLSTTGYAGTEVLGSNLEATDGLVRVFTWTGQVSISSGPLEGTNDTMAFAGQAGTAVFASIFRGEAGEVTITGEIGEVVAGFVEEGVAGSAAFTGEVGDVEVGIEPQGTQDTVAFTGNAGTVVANRVFTVPVLLNGTISSYDTVDSEALNAPTADLVEITGGTESTDILRWAATKETGGSLRYIYRQTFLSFNTSIFGAGSTVLDAKLTVDGEGITEGNGDARAYLFNFGADITTSDWRTPAQLAGLTELATFDDADFSLGQFDFTSNPAFATNINKTGDTQIVIAHAYMEDGTTPTAANFRDISSTSAGSSAPFLTVTLDGTIAGTDFTVEGVAGSLTITEQVGEDPRVNTKIPVFLVTDAVAGDGSDDSDELLIMAALAMQDVFDIRGISIGAGQSGYSGIVSGLVDAYDESRANLVSYGTLAMTPAELTSRLIQGVQSGTTDGLGYYDVSNPQFANAEAVADAIYNASRRQTIDDSPMWIISTGPMMEVSHALHKYGEDIRNSCIVVTGLDTNHSYDPAVPAYMLASHADGNALGAGDTPLHWFNLWNAPRAAWNLDSETGLGDIDGASNDVYREAFNQDMPTDGLAVWFRDSVAHPVAHPNSDLKLDAFFQLAFAYEMSTAGVLDTPATATPAIRLESYTASVAPSGYAIPSGATQYWEPDDRAADTGPVYDGSGLPAVRQATYVNAYRPRLYGIANRAINRTKFADAPYPQPSAEYVLDSLSRLLIDGSSNVTQINDLSGNGNNLTQGTQANQASWDPIEQAVLFNGTTDFYQAGPDVSQLTDDAITVIAKIMPTDGGSAATRGIVSIADAATGDDVSWALYRGTSANPDRPLADVEATTTISGPAAGYAAVLESNRVHVVGFRYSSANGLRHFVDGGNVGRVTGNGVLTQADGKITLGRTLQDTSGEYFQGYVYRLYFYNEELTDSQMMGIYEELRLPTARQTQEEAANDASVLGVAGELTFTGYQGIYNDQIDVTLNPTSVLNIGNAPGTSFADARSEADPGSTYTYFSGTLYPGSYTAGSGWAIEQAFLQFDTSFIPVGSRIDLVTLTVRENDNDSTSDTTLHVYTKVVTDPLSVDDYMTGAEIDAADLLATGSTTNLLANNTFTSQAAFTDNIFEGGTTTLVVVPANVTNNTAPTTNEYGNFSSGSTIQLRVVYAPTDSYAEEALSGSLTFTGYEGVVEGQTSDVIEEGSASNVALTGRVGEIGLGFTAEGTQDTVAFTGYAGIIGVGSTVNVTIDGVAGSLAITERQGEPYHVIDFALDGLDASFFNRYFHTFLPEGAPENEIAADNIILTGDGIILRGQGDLNPTRQKVGAQFATKEHLGPGSFEFTAQVDPGTGAVWAPWSFYYDYKEGAGTATNHEIDWESPSGATYGTQPTNQRYARANTWLTGSNSTGKIVDLQAYDLSAPTIWRFDWHTDPTPKVEFYINGDLITTTTTTVPSIAMRAYFSFWYANWAGAADHVQREVLVSRFKYTPYVDQPYTPIPPEWYTYQEPPVVDLEPEGSTKFYKLPATARSGALSSTSTTSRAAARTGENLTVYGVASSSNVRVGDGVDTGTHEVDQVFFEFDATSIPPEETIVYAELFIGSTGTSPGSNDTVLLFKEWGAAVDAGDWVTPAEMPGLTVVNTRTDNAAFNTNYAYPKWPFGAEDVPDPALVAGIRRDAVTQFVIVHKATYDNTSEPAGENYAEFYAPADESALYIVTRTNVGGNVEVQAVAGSMSITEQAGVETVEQVYTFTATEMGALRSSAASFSDMAAGVGTFTIYGTDTDTVNTTYYSNSFNGATYDASQIFVRFDTRPLGLIGAPVLRATLSVKSWTSDIENGDGAASVYGFDWGNTVDTSDWRSPFSLTNLTLAATCLDNTADITGARWEFTSEVGMPSTLQQNDYTGFVIAHQGFANDVGASQLNYVSVLSEGFVSNEADFPELTVVIDGTQATFTDFSVEGVAGSMAFTGYVGDAGGLTQDVNISAVYHSDNLLSLISPTASNDFTSGGGWGGFAGVTPAFDFRPAAFGAVQDASLISDNNNTQWHSRKDNYNDFENYLGGLLGEYFTFSIFVRKEEETAPGPGIELYDVSREGIAVQLRDGPDKGKVIWYQDRANKYDSVPLGAIDGGVQDYGDYYRLWMTMQLTEADGRLDWEIFPAEYNSQGNRVVNAGSGTVFWGAMLEYGNIGPGPFIEADEQPSQALTFTGHAGEVLQLNPADALVAAPAPGAYDTTFSFSFDASVNFVFRSDGTEGTVVTTDLSEDFAAENNLFGAYDEVYDTTFDVGYESYMNFTGHVGAVNEDIIIGVDIRLEASSSEGPFDDVFDTSFDYGSQLQFRLAEGQVERDDNSADVSLESQNYGAFDETPYDSEFDTDVSNVVFQGYAGQIIGNEGEALEAISGSLAFAGAKGLVSSDFGFQAEATAGSVNFTGEQGAVSGVAVTTEAISGSLAFTGYAGDLTTGDNSSDVNIGDTGAGSVTFAGQVGTATIIKSATGVVNIEGGGTVTVTATADAPLFKTGTVVVDGGGSVRVIGNGYEPLQDGVDELVQLPEGDTLIELFKMDLSNLGGGVFYFVKGTLDGTEIIFNGNTYTPLPIRAEGFKWNGQGPLPTPTILLSNVSSVIRGLLLQYDDLLGAEISRTQTFKRFLDGQPDADPNATLGTEIYRVERKSGQAGTVVELELSSVIDNEGAYLPARQAIRDLCRWDYRVWNGSSFEQTSQDNYCPYSGGSYFDEDDIQVFDPALDRCSKTLTGCQKRFQTGINAIFKVLPFGGFPGMRKS